MGIRREMMEEKGTIRLKEKGILFGEMKQG